LENKRVSQIVGILKELGRIQKNQLIILLEKEGLMSHQTASNAIEEAVNLHKIIREEEYRGKQKIVFLTVYSDIAKDQERVLMENKKWLKSFDARFSFFTNKFSSLSIEEKAVGIDLFSVLLLHFQVTIEALWVNFGRTRKWKTLLDKIRPRITSINNLLKSCSNKEHGMIGAYLIEGKLHHLGEMMEQTNEYLKDIKKVQNS